METGRKGVSGKGQGGELPEDGSYKDRIRTEKGKRVRRIPLLQGTLLEPTRTMHKRRGGGLPRDLGGKKQNEANATLP